LRRERLCFAVIAGTVPLRKIAGKSSLTKVEKNDTPNNCFAGPRILYGPRRWIDLWRNGFDQLLAAELRAWFGVVDDPIDHRQFVHGLNLNMQRTHTPGPGARRIAGEAA